MLLKVFSNPFLSVNLVRFTQGLFYNKALNKNNSFIACHNSYSFSSSPSQSLQVHPQQTQLYTQRAFTPSQITKQLISELPKTPLPTIIHQLTLYSQKLLPFDYDYFVESLKWISPHQNNLSLTQLLMLFDLAIEYKIDNVLIQSHFQNELYCRVYLMTKKELVQYDIDVKNQLDRTYQALQAGSKDHFNVISDKFKELLEDNGDQDGQNEQRNSDKGEQDQQSNNDDKAFTAQQLSSSIQPQKLANKPTYNASERKLKSKFLQQQLLNRITHIFLQSNSRNIEFNNLLLQINTIRLDEYTQTQSSLQAPKQHPQLTPSFLLTYTRLATNLLQLYMTEYQAAVDASTKSQPAKYTRRSVKHIYKVQAFYYYELAKLVEEKKLLQGATDTQLGDFIQLLSGFPIKRRSFRKSIGEVLIEQYKKRQLPYDNLMKFFQLSRFDNKLLQHYENRINGIEVKKIAQKKPQLVEENTYNAQISNSQPNPLVPEVLNEEETQKNSLDDNKLFKLPTSLFRKVTKKKSKPKNKKFINPESQEIDLTQPDEGSVQNQGFKNNQSSSESSDNHKVENTNSSLKQKQEMAK